MGLLKHFMATKEEDEKSHGGPLPGRTYILNCRLTKLSKLIIVGASVPYFVSFGSAFLRGQGFNDFWTIFSLAILPVFFVATVLETSIDVSELKIRDGIRAAAAKEKEAAKRIKGLHEKLDFADRQDTRQIREIQRLKEELDKAYTEKAAWHQNAKRWEAEAARLKSENEKTQPKQPAAAAKPSPEAPEGLLDDLIARATAEERAKTRKGPK